MANAEFKTKRIMLLGFTCSICILLLADPAEPQQLRNRSSGLTQFLSSVPTKRSLDAIPQKVTGALRAALANLADRGIKASNFDKSVAASFSRDMIRFQATGEVQVYVFLSKAPPEKEVSLLEKSGLRVERIQEETKRVQGWISIDKVADLAALAAR